MDSPPPPATTALLILTMDNVQCYIMLRGEFHRDLGECRHNVAILVVKKIYQNKPFLFEFPP